MSSGLFGCYLEAVRVGNKWKIRMKWRNEGREGHCGKGRLGMNVGIKHDYFIFTQMHAYTGCSHLPLSLFRMTSFGSTGIDEHKEIYLSSDRERKSETERILDNVAKSFELDLLSPFRLPHLSQTIVSVLLTPHAENYLHCPLWSHAASAYQGIR